MDVDSQHLKTLPEFHNYVQEEDVANHMLGKLGT